MAKPRVFISSTYYDLRQVREDLERTIREIGYEPVRNETGAIPYGKDGSPESGAYREVELCDVIVSIIGGRYGTESSVAPGSSISQTELRRALEKGIQVFVFIEKSVHAEFSTYELNKENPGTKYRFADNVKIYQFIEEIQKLPRNNPIAPFETAQDISNYLREQFAGLFHRFLQENKRAVEMRLIDEMNATARTLKEVVSFLTEQNKNNSEAFKFVILMNHPVFNRLAKLTGCRYRVFFTTHNEFAAWMTARNWEEVSSEQLDEGSIAEWTHEPTRKYVAIKHQLFAADGSLAYVSPTEWQDNWVVIKPLRVADAPRDDDAPADDDEIPF